VEDRNVDHLRQLTSHPQSAIANRVGETWDTTPWRFTSADARDSAGNLGVISGADAAQLADGVTVISSAPDTTAPVFIAVSFSPTTVDVSSGAATTMLSAHVADVGSGVSQYRIFLTGPTGVLLQCGTATVPPQSGTVNDGTWTCPITFPAGSAAGPWRFTSADARDSGGNLGVISGADAAQWRTVSR
jgi:hypothetical protein